jgi:hypothetical protein
MMIGLYVSCCEITLNSKLRSMWRKKTLFVKCVTNFAHFGHNIFIFSKMGTALFYFNFCIKNCWFKLSVSLSVGVRVCTHVQSSECANKKPTKIPAVRCTGTGISAVLA